MKREIKFEVGYNCEEYECISNSSRCHEGQGGYHGKGDALHGKSIRKSNKEV